MPDNINEELYQAIQSTLTKYADLFVTNIRQQLLESGRLASGTLYNSVVFQVSFKDSNALVEIYAEDYFKYINDGRKPGQAPPPIESIIKWVELRGIRGRGIPDTKHGLPRSNKGLAYLIARSIGINGIKPINALKKTNDQFLNKLFVDVDGIIEKKTAEIIAREFQEAAKNNNIKVSTNIN